MCHRKVPARYFMILGCCISLAISYIMRSSLSQRTADIQMHQEPICPMHSCHNYTTNQAEFKMTPRQRGLMNGAFYWGYFVTCMVGGVLSDLFNNKIFMLGSLFGTSIITCFTPILRRKFKWLGITFSGLIMGLSQGILYTTLIAIAAEWIPPQERSSLGSILFATPALGVALTHLLEILLRNIDFDWTKELYLYSGAGFLVVILIYSTLTFYPKHLMEEGGKFYDEYHAHMVEKKEYSRNVPLKAILHNIHVWAVVCACFGHAWNFFMMASFVPTYLHSVLPISFTSELLMFIIFMSAWSGAIISGFICDYVQKRNLISLTWNRKITYIIGSTTTAACNIAISYLKCNQAWVIACAIIGSTSVGLYYSSVKINPLDLNPTYAATINSVGQMGVCSAGLLVQYFYSSIIKTGSIEEWRILHWMTSSIVLIGGVTFFIFASAEEQTLGIIHQDLQHGRQSLIA